MSDRRPTQDAALAAPSESLREAESPLPYLDFKPVGAPGFYLAINATFRFVLLRFGYTGLKHYWTQLGRTYFRPVTRRWRNGGRPALAAYWRAFFRAEPGGKVEVQEVGETVVVRVQVCPALAYLKAQEREIVPSFCQHCYFIGNAMAQEAGYTVRVEGGNGICRQTFAAKAYFQDVQCLDAIEEVR